MRVVLPVSPKLSRSGWYKYLVRGFKEVADEVVQTDKLLKDCFFITGKMIIPIDIYSRRIWYDFSDFYSLYPSIMNDNDLYFKVQYYDDVVKNTNNVFPIGFGASRSSYFKDLNTRRKLKEQKKYDYDIIGVFRTTNYNTRRKVVEIIRSRKDWKSLAWLEQTDNRPKVPKELLGASLQYTDHLMKQCKSKLCLAIHGVGIRFGINGRISEILGTGNCLILPELEARMPSSLEGSAIILKRDLSDMQEKVDYYLSHDEERESIARSGLEYYEKWLSPKAIANNIISKL